MKRVLLALFLPTLLVACAPSHILGDTELAGASKLGDVMWSQAAVADPAFKKIGEAAYTDADWAAISAAAKRLQLSSAKLKASFSKGTSWDALADQLGQKATTLLATTETKDVKAASDALTDVKSTCKTCHKSFR
jgi:cytochrome c556